MELKHFSHNHGLAFHQVPQGTQIHCSACKSPASANAYACWQCNYFLHEQCFRAARSLKHPSHPHHPLTLVPFPTYPSGSFVCNTCNHSGDGFSYTCSECEFDLHVHCALMPTPNPHPLPNYNSQPQNPIYPPPHNFANQNYPPPQPQPQSTSYPPPVPNANHNPPLGYPQPNATPQTVNHPPQQEPATIIKHFSHPHFLNSIEIKEKNGKVCSGCEWEITGSAYSCNEPHCSFILDKGCFDAPREGYHKSHPQHSLTLRITSPDAPFDCYACWSSGKGFAYTCLACSFTLHIDCVGWAQTVAAGVSHQHALTLYYSAAEACGQQGSITCAVCQKVVNQKAWCYYCRDCGVGCHTMCRAKWKNATPAPGKTGDITDQLVKMQELQMQMEMTRVHAQMIASIGSSVCNLI
ncbi:hypothetical protein ACS0TY_019860 [Phlomoides rotata]